MGALALATCVYDWDAYDPSHATGSSSSGSGGGGATSSGGSGGGGGSSSGQAGGGATAGSGGGLAGSGGLGGAGGAGGQGAGPTEGCSDGTRELYPDAAAEPDIAGCSGGFDVPGLKTAASMSPACNRLAGNDSTNPNGSGCSVEDLCSADFHVCASAAEVAQSAASGACPAQGSVPALWVTRQAQHTSSDACIASGSNNLLGCGQVMGSAAPDVSCSPLNRRTLHAECNAATGWDCGSSSYTTSEQMVVIKPSPLAGGVLCCRLNGAR